MKESLKATFRRSGARWYGEQAEDAATVLTKYVAAERNSTTAATALAGGAPPDVGAVGDGGGTFQRYGKDPPAPRFSGRDKLEPVTKTSPGRREPFRPSSETRPS